jgi:hypothetical protein
MHPTVLNFKLSLIPMTKLSKSKRISSHNIAKIVILNDIKIQRKKIKEGKEK